MPPQLCCLRPCVLIVLLILESEESPAHLQRSALDILMPSPHCMSFCTRLSNVEVEEFLAIRRGDGDKGCPSVEARFVGGASWNGDGKARAIGEMVWTSR